MEHKTDILNRLRLVYFILGIFALLIIAKVLYIQFKEGDHWKEQARAMTMRFVSIDAVRGDICAEDGRLLATSLPVYEIRMDLSSRVIPDDLFFAQIDSLAFHLSRLFGDRSAAQYRSSLRRARQNQERYYLVKRNVSHAQLQELMTFPLFRLGRFRGGLIVEERTRREMPYRTMAARTIGYEREGVYVGLEGAYREILEGQQGQRLEQRISGGSWMPVSDQNEIQPQNGMDIITTISVPIQDITEKALLRQLNRFRAEHGTAVVMEVSTGKVKAISNLMRNEQTNTYEELYNFAVGYSTEPGSTFKLPALMVALEDRHVHPDDTIDTGNGRIRYYGRLMRDANDEEHGKISAQQAFEVSSNVGVSKIIHTAYKDKPQAFVDGLKRMNLHQPLRVEISGEGEPVIRDAGSPGWSRISLPWMAIGYEVSLTPLQLLGFYNAVANNGKMMKPMFVTEIRQSGRTIERFSPEVINPSIASAGTIEYARKMLTGVVEHGTARNIRSDAYPIAGKTGTAQVAQQRRGYQTDAGISYQATFVGFFPADKPVYSCIVMIHNPQGYIFHGSRVAAPVFREIADKLFAAQMFFPEPVIQQNEIANLPTFRNANTEDMKQIYSTFNAIFKETTTNSFASSHHENDTVFFREKTFIENLVPEVVGMSLKDAIYLMENAGLSVRFSGRGIVRSQSLRPGTRIREGSVVYLELS